MRKLKLFISQWFQNIFSFFNNVKLNVFGGISKNMKYKQLFKNFVDFVFDCVNLALAVFFLSLILALRFLPRTSRDLWQNMSQEQLLITLLTLFVIFLNIYHTLKLLGIIKTKNAFPIVKRLKKGLSAFFAGFMDIFKNFYDFVWNRLELVSKKLFNYPYLHYHVIRLLAKSFVNPKHFPYYFVMLISVKFIPKTIFIIVLFCDVIVYNHLDLTFRCLPLLLFIFLEDIFIFILEDFHEKHMPAISTYVIEEKYTNMGYVYYNPACINDYPYGTKSDYEFLMDHYCVIQKVPAMLLKYEQWKSYKSISYYYQLFLQLIRLLIYVYILIYGIT